VGQVKSRIAEFKYQRPSEDPARDLRDPVKLKEKGRTNTKNWLSNYVTDVLALSWNSVWFGKVWRQEAGGAKGEMGSSSGID
jgi:hypothetical protein